MEGEPGPGLAGGRSRRAPIGQGSRSTHTPATVELRRSGSDSRGGSETGSAVSPSVRRESRVRTAVPSAHPSHLLYPAEATSPRLDTGRTPPKVLGWKAHPTAEGEPSVRSPGRVRGWDIWAGGAHAAPTLRRARRRATRRVCSSKLGHSDLVGHDGCHWANGTVQGAHVSLQHEPVPLPKERQHFRG